MACVTVRVTHTSRLAASMKKNNKRLDQLDSRTAGRHCSDQSHSHLSHARTVVRALGLLAVSGEMLAAVWTRRLACLYSLVAGSVRFPTRLQLREH